MRHRLFQSAHTILKNAMVDQVTLPPNAFPTCPVNNAVTIGMSVAVSTAIAGMWLHGRNEDPKPNEQPKIDGEKICPAKP